MRKEYYFNKEFLKLLKLDNKKSYARESIFNRIKELNLMKKRVRKRGRYGITKFFYYTSNFHEELEILRKKTSLKTLISEWLQKNLFSLPKCFLLFE